MYTLHTRTIIRFLTTAGITVGMAGRGTGLRSTLVVIRMGATVVPLTATPATVILIIMAATATGVTTQAMAITAGVPITAAEAIIVPPLTTARAAEARITVGQPRDPLRLRAPRLVFELAAAAVAGRWADRADQASFNAVIHFPAGFLSAVPFLVRA